LREVHLTAQYLNSEMPPHYKPEKRHRGATKTMEYQEEAKKFADGMKEYDQCWIVMFLVTVMHHIVYNCL
jgi:hypothetical protein